MVLVGQNKVNYTTLEIAGNYGFTMSEGRKKESVVSSTFSMICYSVIAVLGTVLLIP